MNTITINQPAGLGDIIWVQPILQMFVDKGFNIIYPVIDHYLPMAKEYLPRNNVEYVSLNVDYPFKDSFDSKVALEKDSNYYLPLTYSHLHFPNSSLMISKYLFTQTPIQDWRGFIPRIRNLDREKKLFEKVNPKGSEYVLVNKIFGTPPNTLEREINLSDPNLKVITIDYRDNDLTEFHPFDWIGIIENAKEVHFVQTAFSFIVDLYAPPTANLHLYDRVGVGQPQRFLKDFEYVQRHPNWVYHV
jgi:hypothetical protein